jgi:hypothetical protein
MSRQKTKLIVAVDDSLFPFLPEADVTHLTSDGRAIQFVPASAFSDPADADLYVGDYVPSARGRRFLMQLDSGAVYEVDDDGRVVVDGKELVPGARTPYRLVACADAQTGKGNIAIGRVVALLLMAEDADGVDLAIRLAGPVVVAGGVPHRVHRRVPAGWARLVTERVA